MHIQPLFHLKDKSNIKYKEKEKNNVRLFHLETRSTFSFKECIQFLFIKFYMMYCILFRVLRSAFLTVLYPSGLMHTKVPNNSLN